MSISVQDIVSAVESYALPELEQLIKGLCPCLPVEALVSFGEAIASEIEARNEADAMKAGVSAADAAADAAEEAALAATAK